MNPHLPARVGARILAPALVASLVALAPAAGAEDPMPRPSYTWSATPSKVWVKRPLGYVKVRPWVACWNAPPANGSTLCFDGIRPASSDLQRFRGTWPIRFWFGMPKWRFHARITSLRHPNRKACRSGVHATRVAPRWFRLARPGRPGLYRVDLSGSGPQGDVTVSFAWRVGKWRRAVC